MNISNKKIRILLTAFEPFGSGIINSSAKVLEELNNIETVDLFCLVLPVSFDKSVKLALDAIEQLNPHVVLSMGQAGGRSSIDIERVGLNIDDCKGQDNDGCGPFCRFIVDGAPDALFTTIPVKKLVSCICAKGISSRVSNSAGTFVCNHLLYSLLYYVKTNNLPIKVGFIHLPYLPEQVLDKQEKLYMNLSDMVAAVEIIIEELKSGFLFE